MLRKKAMKKSFLAIICISVLSSFALFPAFDNTNRSVYAETEAAESDIDAGAQSENPGSFREDGYDQYLAAHESAAKPDEQITVEAESFTNVEGMNTEILENYEGSSGKSVKTDETGSIEWEIDVRAAGLYNFGIKYFPMEGKSSSIERQLLIDGKSPFFGADTLVFPRVWGNEKAEVERDNRDNDLRPRQVEHPVWQETLFKDIEGFYEKPYYFYLSAGNHRLTFVSSREPLVIDYIKIYQEDKIPKYADLVKQYEANGYKEAKGELIKVQGEDAVAKSAPTLYPITDRASPATEPYDISKIRINTVGGNNWRLPGHWIAWDVEAPQDGLYRIGIKYRQNLLRGIYSTRKLWIDNAVPFEEMEKIPFFYDGNWQMKVLGDDNDQPYLFYLTKGKHELKLENTLGDMAPLLRQVESSVLELNAIYRKILMITGATPDPFRDYLLERQIPEMLEIFTKQKEILTNVAEQLEALTGETGEKTAILNTMSRQLDDMLTEPETIPRRLAKYKEYVGGLGTWILDVREQPLEIDYVIAASPEEDMPKPDASWIRNLGHELGAFFYSFIEDYNTIGNVAEDAQMEVNVWIGTGRDQAQVLKSMIDDTFTPQTGIHINLKLVNMGVLLPATLAKEGPDVAMQIGNDIPVNYGIRQAAQDLTQFPDFEEVTASFRDSAFVPYRFQDAVYALPEQQSFSMLFYRKDVLSELGIEVPQTWDDVYNIIPILQKHHMEFELPLAQNTAVPILVPNEAFAMFLYQADGKFYKEGGIASNLDSDLSMQAFKRWSGLYTNYKFPLTFDFANRFRTGEMPIGVADYTLYNTLAVFAPEIRGLWEFVPVPGTLQPDGTIRRDVASNGSAVIMLKQSQEKDASWQFMKWWTSKDTQVRFGREMEGLLGAAARYPTANIEALQELPWPIKDYRNLEEQWKWVQGIPEVPGGYFTGRHLDNAFREVVNNGTNTREALSDYVRFINDEITTKRKEFNLSK